MANNTFVSYEELTMSNLLEIEAVINILEKKGILTKAEVLDEVQKLKIEIEENIKKNTREN